MDLLCNYVSYTKTELILVFDAYLVKNGEGSEFMHNGYKVVYTKANQTADAYIEKIIVRAWPRLQHPNGDMRQAVAVLCR